MKKNFLKNVLILSGILLFSNLNAQEYVPYRKGKLWGISDEKAKIVVKPQYDSVVIKSIEPSYFFETFKNKKKGYVINNKEIIPAKYDAIKNIDRTLLFASNRTEDNLYVQDFYTADGKKLLKTPAYFVEQYDISNFPYFSDESTDHRELIKFTDEKQKESVFIWNSNQQKIEIWLLKDVHSIVLNPKHSPRGKLLIHYKKSENSPLEDVYFAIENNKVVQTEKTAKQLKIDYDYLERGEGILVEAYDGTGRDYSSDVVIEGKPYETSVKNSVRSHTSYVLNNGKITKKTFASRNSQTEDISFSFQPETAELKSASFSITENDTVRSYSNYITYRFKGKSGFFYKEPYNRSIEYDTLIWKPGISSGNYEKPKPFIVAGNKKDGVFRYGVVDIDHQIILPIEYQEINPCRIAFSFWITKKNDKFQIFPTKEEDSKWLSKEYDLIESINDFLLVKKGKKYGVISKENALKDKLSESEIIFDYRIRKVTYKFYKEANESKYRITRLELEDENRKFLGYANPNGTLYFED